jgi:hypothetical protein
MKYKQAKSVKSLNPYPSVILTIYDTVKAHGGELNVETLHTEAVAQAGKEGVGTNFIIKLPMGV